MRLDEALLRTRKLIESGRYRTFSARYDPTLFEVVHTQERMLVDGEYYTPYRHHLTQQLIYGRRVKGPSGDVIHGMAFTKTEYTFGKKDAYVWFDHDLWGFNYL